MSGIAAGSTLAELALQTDSLTSDVATAAAVVLVLSLVAGGLAAVVALLYRWYVRERVPAGLPILVGLSGVAVYLGSSSALRQVIAPTAGSGDPLDETIAVINIVTFGIGLLAARAGTDVGDRIGTDVFVASGAAEVESEVGRVVQAVGRVITVEMPDDIEDIVGYDPVPDETKDALAGKTFVFPRRLTVTELRDRLVTRLKADYAVGHVDLELADDGTVAYLALGSRAAGIGPTLPPETSAVAIRADPAFAAGAGDLVQVWRTDPFERVLTAEVRATADDAVTLAVDAADTRKLDDATEYRLVTLPVETRPDREFASLLRAADETMATVDVAGGSQLDGQPVGALAVAVVAVRPSDGAVEPLPARDRVLDAGDSLYLVARPDAIRKVESAARSSAGGSTVSNTGAEMPPERHVDATTPVESADSSGDTEAGVDVELGEPELADVQIDEDATGSRGSLANRDEADDEAVPRDDEGGGVDADVDAVAADSADTGPSDADPWNADPTGAESPDPDLTDAEPSDGNPADAEAPDEPSDDSTTAGDERTETDDDR